jgi:hypothetical protein
MTSEHENIMKRAGLRLLSATPGELLKWNAGELKRAIKRSEGRTLLAYARCRCANLVDYVSNAELAAAFGADIVMLNCFDMNDPIIPGLPSKNILDDEPVRKIQVPLGRGILLSEIRKLIGRVVGVLLVHTQDKDDNGQKFSYGEVKADVGNAVKAVESGADILCFLAWGDDNEKMLKTLKEIRLAVGNKCLIEFFRPHGPGLMGMDGRIGNDLLREDEIEELVKAGADIIGLPAPASHFGWTVEKSSRIVEEIHKYGALASVGIHTSQEGSDADTIRRIAVYAKMTGADMHELGDIGYNECMVLPENIMTYGVAIRGRRHHYRRMAMSILR